MSANFGSGLNLETDLKGKRLHMTMTERLFSVTIAMKESTFYDRRYLVKYWKRILAILSILLLIVLTIATEQYENVIPDFVLHIAVIPLALMATPWCHQYLLDWQILLQQDLDSSI